jgi:hypothetical protein
VANKADGPEGTVQTCTAGNVFVFEHSPLAQASALDRKKKRDELNLKAPLSLCPGGLSACAVPGIDGAYEVHLILAWVTGGLTTVS